MKLTSRLVKWWFMLLVIAISLWVGGCNLFSSFTDGSSSMASEAREDNLGNAVVVVPVAVAIVGVGLVDVAVVCWWGEVEAEPEGERRDEVATEAAATASSSLSVRLSLTRSDKLLTTKWKVIVVSHCLRICTYCGQKYFGVATESTWLSKRFHEIFYWNFYFAHWIKQSIPKPSMNKNFYEYQASWFVIVLLKKSLKIQDS